MSHLNDGHVGFWERLIKENVKPQSEAEIKEEYQEFLKRMKAYHIRNAHHPSCNCPLCYEEKVKKTAAYCAVSPDLINHPPHYTQGGIDTFDFIKAKGLNYSEGNVIKYITRSRHKGNLLDDLKKAKWYLNKLIKEAEKQ